MVNLFLVGNFMIFFFNKLFQICPFFCFYRSSNGSPSRPNLVGNITLSDNKLRSQDPECTSIVPVKFCPEMVSPSSFAHHSMAQSVALKNATKLKTKITTDFSNSLVKKEELPQTKFRRPCVQKDFCTSCPYNLRYRILAS